MRLIHATIIEFIIVTINYSGEDKKYKKLFPKMIYWFLYEIYSNIFSVFISFTN